VKKPVVIGVVGTAMAATAVFVWSRMGGGGAVPAAAALDAETTVGAIGVDPVSAWRAARGVLEALPTLAVDKTELALLSPAAVQAQLGFDPETPEGWASVGLDVTAGVTFAVDARAFGAAGGVPLALVRVTDRAKFLTGLEKATGTKPTLTDLGDGLSRLSLGDASLLWGERRGLTVLGLVTDEADAERQRGLFRAFVQGEGSALSRDDAWQTAFRDARAPLSSWIFLGAKGGAALEKSLDLPAEVDVVAEHYVKLFPAFASWNWVAGEPGGMLVTSPDALRALEQIMRPRKAPPRFTPFLPPSAGVAFRYSVNLVELTGGIAALLPPNVPPQVRMGMEMGKALLPMQVGISWGELTDALSGHFALGVDPARVKGFADTDDYAGAVVALAGVQVPERADALLLKLSNAGKDKLGLEIAAVDIAGAKGYHVGPADGGVTVVRKDDVLVAGVHEAVDSAVRGTAGLRDAAAARLDEDVAFAFYWNPSALGPFLARAEFPQGPGIERLLKGNGAGGGQVLESRLVSNGLRFSGTGGAEVGGATTALATMALFGVQAFLGGAAPIIDEPVPAPVGGGVSADLDRMADGAVAWFDEQKIDQSGNILARRFPGAGATLIAPEDWHARVCVDGVSRDYPADPEAFSHPVFQALKFQKAEPFRYQYQFVSAGEGSAARFTARAIGDLDCDGVYSTFEKTGRVGSDGEVVVDALVTEKDPAE
jgi:hypothetical protein